MMDNMHSIDISSATYLPHLVNVAYERPHTGTAKLAIFIFSFIENSQIYSKEFHAISMKDDDSKGLLLNYAQ